MGCATFGKKHKYGEGAVQAGAPMTSTKPIPIRLPIPLYRDVDREARKAQVSRSEIMRQLIREAMAARRSRMPHPKQ